MKKHQKAIRVFRFIILLLGIYSFGYITAAPMAENKITLKGAAHEPGPPRIPPAPALEAYLDFDVITVYFLNNLGNVNITITDEWGDEVYHSIEPSAYGASVVIDISGLEPGVYTITFTNSP